MNGNKVVMERPEFCKFCGETMEPVFLSFDFKDGSGNAGFECRGCGARGYSKIRERK